MLCIYLSLKISYVGALRVAGGRETRHPIKLTLAKKWKKKFSMCKQLNHQSFAASTGPTISGEHDDGGKAPSLDIWVVTYSTLKLSDWIILCDQQGPPKQCIDLLQTATTWNVQLTHMWEAVPVPLLPRP